MIYMIGKSARFTRSGILLILSILSNCFSTHALPNGRASETALSESRPPRRVIIHT
jgi:hypothetical protein